MWRIATAVALLHIASNCGDVSQSRTSNSRTAQRVSTVTALHVGWPVTFRANGSVRGLHTSTLSSKTTGYVRAMRVESGDFVQAGDVLAELEANDARANVARAKAAFAHALEVQAESKKAVEAASAISDLARSSHGRFSVLFASAVVSRQQYDEAEARLRTSAAEHEMASARLRAASLGVEAAKADLSGASATLQYSTIRAPFSGRVLERHVDEGTLASPGMALLTLSDGGPMRAEAFVAESRLDRLHVGDEASVEVEGIAVPFTVRVSEIVPNIDVSTRTSIVKLDLPASAGPLRPGGFARVTFVVGSRSALAIPTSAISSFGALDRVFVVEPRSPRVARLRMVSVGDRHGALTEVLAGLASGDVVVLRPSSDLRDGALIEPAL